MHVRANHPGGQDPGRLAAWDFIDRKLSLSSPYQSLTVASRGERSCLTCQQGFIDLDSAQQTNCSANSNRIRPGPVWSQISADFFNRWSTHAGGLLRRTAHAAIAMRQLACWLPAAVRSRRPLSADWNVATPAARRKAHEFKHVNAGHRSGRRRRGAKELRKRAWMCRAGTRPLVTPMRRKDD